MRVLERRLRRLEVGLLPQAETPELRRLHEIVLGIRRRRAARLGLPVPEDVPAPAHRPGVSIGGMIGNNSAGSGSVVHGMTIDHVESLEVVLSDSSAATLGPVDAEQMLRSEER